MTALPLHHFLVILGMDSIWRDRHLKLSSEFCDDYTEGNDNLLAVQRQQRGRSDSCSSSDYDDDYSCYSTSFDNYGYCSSYDSCYSSNRNRSRYHTRWNGFFIGFDFDYRFLCDFTLYGCYEFHWAQYHARARWNLREDLCNGFRHRAKNAYGNYFDIGLRWDFCECRTVSIKGEFQWWYADHGRDRALIADCRDGNVKTKCFLNIPLRDVRWHSEGVAVDVGMVF